MNIVELGRILIITLILCLLVYDAVMLLAGWQKSLPQDHKQLLLTGVLLWFMSIFFNKNSDDDWVGQV